MFTTSPWCGRKTTECAGTRRQIVNKLEKDWRNHIRTRPSNRESRPSLVQSGSPELGSTTSKRSSLGPNGLRSADPIKEPSARRGRTCGRNVWLAREFHKLSLEVSRHKDLRNGRIRWLNLASAWESQRNPEDPQRTVAALKAAYAKLRKTPVMEDVEEDERREDSEAEGNPSLGTSEVNVVGFVQAREGYPDLEPITVTAPLSEPSLKDQVLQRVELYLNVASTFRDRVSIRRPGSEIPKDLLEIGNDILRERMPEPVSQGQRYITKLNDLVYAVARAIAATTDRLGQERSGSLKMTLSEEIERRRVIVSSISIISSELDRRKVRKRSERKRVSRKYLKLSETLGDRADSSLELVRYLRQLKDQLNTTQQTIKRLEETKRLQFVRRKGASYVVNRRVSSEKDTVVVPVTSVSEYWKPIVGTRRPFRAGFQLKKWAEDLETGLTPETGQELSEEAWRE
ncbi:unnamed protein product, partial [Cylicostephanus goldi]